MLNAKTYLQDTSKKESSQFLIGTISSTYSSGLPSVTVDGESTSTVKTYPYLSSYTPVASDRVLLALVSNSYVILGKIQN